MSLTTRKSPNPFAIIAKQEGLVPLSPHASEIFWHLDMTHLSSEHVIIFNAIHHKRSQDVFQWGFKKKELTPEKLSQIIALSHQGYNVYCSEASFLKPHLRTKANAFSSEALIIDIDYYNIPSLKGLSAEQVIAKMKAEGLLEKLPPSYVMSSGKGLYLVYLLELLPLYSFPRNIRLWELVAKHLTKHFESYGADMHATDISRVTRLPYTINPKNNKQAYILDWSHLSTTSPKRYTLSFLANEILPYSYHEVETYRTEKKEKKQLDPTSPKKAHQLLTPISLATARCEDLEYILSRRSHDIEGYRNIFIFLYSVFSMDKLRDLTLTTTSVKSINSLLVSPLPDAEVDRCIQSAYQSYIEKQKNFKFGYKFTNDNIISLLQISDDEVKELKTILTEEEKRERFKKAQKAKRRNEFGLTPRQQKVANTQDKILELYAQNMDVKSIAQQLGLSTRQVYRYLKK